MCEVNLGVSSNRAANSSAEKNIAQLKTAAFIVVVVPKNRSTVSKDGNTNNTINPKMVVLLWLILAIIAVDKAELQVVCDFFTKV